MVGPTTPAPVCTRPAAQDRHPPEEVCGAATIPLRRAPPCIQGHAHPGTAAAGPTIRLARDRLPRRVESGAQLAQLLAVGGLVAAEQVGAPALAVVHVRDLVGEQVVEHARDLLLPELDQHLAAVRV